MIQRLKRLWIRWQDALLYLVFGGLTTAVNYAVYLPCYNIFHLGGAGSNMIAWVAAVAFAFVTNKPFVFKSRDWSSKTVLPELGKFVGCRVVSGILETGILLVTVDWLLMDGNWMKLLTSVFVVIANYFASKLLVFQKK